MYTINKENDAILKPSQFGVFAWNEMRKRTSAENPEDEEAAILYLSSYFFADSRLLLKLDNEDKGVIRALDSLTDISELSSAQIIALVYRALNRTYASWRGVVQAMLFIKKAHARLLELGDLNYNETWLGFETGPDDFHDVCSFVHMAKDLPIIVCLSIGDNVNIMASINDDVVEKMLSPLAEGKNQNANIGTIFAPVPESDGTFREDSGALKSLSVAELIVLYGSDPGIGNFYPGSVSNAYLNLSINRRVTTDN